MSRGRQLQSSPVGPAPGKPASYCRALDGERTSADMLDRTLQVWQPWSGRPLTREDAREITTNVSGFFMVLADWAAENHKLRLTSGGDSK